MDTKIWLNNPKILFHKDKVLEVWPYTQLSFNEKMNATTRFVIYVSLFGYVFLNNYLILLLGVIIISILIITYKYNTIEQFESLNSPSLDQGKHSSKNPLYNVLNSDYVDDVNKEGIKEDYGTTKESEINHQTKQFIYEANKSNKDIGNIFKNLSDKIGFESSMRQFYINPSTTIPNNQKDFLNYCYGNLHSEKPLLIY